MSSRCGYVRPAHRNGPHHVTALCGKGHDHRSNLPQADLHSLVRVDGTADLKTERKEGNPGNNKHHWRHCSACAGYPSTMLRVLVVRFDVRSFSTSA